MLTMKNRLDGKNKTKLEIKKQVFENDLEFQGKGLIVNDKQSYINLFYS